MLPAILENQSYKRAFIKISKTSEAVIVSRASPSQKADVVRMIKEDDSEAITLAIGDGANDVAMIREAHIGVGLYGNEGMQAVNSSDFALGEFKMLWRLLLVHGRLFYIRNAEMILYFFYKNVVITMAHFYFAFSNGISGQTIFDSFYITFYNLMFTSWPLIIKAAFETDVNYHIDGDSIRRFYPHLYYMGAQKTVYNSSNYLSSQFFAFLDSFIVYFIPIGQQFLQEDSILNSRGKNTDLWSLSLVTFTTVYIAVTVKICSSTHWWTWVNFLFYSVFSVLVYYSYIWLSEYLSMTSQLFVAETHKSPNAFMTILFCLLFCMMVNTVYEYLKIEWFKSASDWMRIFVHEKRANQEVDEKGYIKVTEQDCKDFDEFMKPIRQHYKEE